MYSRTRFKSDLLTVKAPYPSCHLNFFLVRKVVVSPSGGLRFDDSKEIGKGNVWEPANEKMDVIGHTADFEKRSVVRSDDAAEVLVEAWLEIVVDERETVLG